MEPWMLQVLVDLTQSVAIVLLCLACWRNA